MRLIFITIMVLAFFPHLNAQEDQFENKVKFEISEEFKLTEEEAGKKRVYTNNEGVTVSLILGQRLEDTNSISSIAALSMAMFSEMVNEFEINYEEKAREINGYTFTIFIYSYLPVNASDREITTSYFTSYNNKLVNLAFTCSREQFDQWNEEFGYMISTIRFE